MNPNALLNSLGEQARAAYGSVASVCAYVPVARAAEHAAGSFTPRTVLAYVSGLGRSPRGGPPDRSPVTAARCLVVLPALKNGEVSTAPEFGLGDSGGVVDARDGDKIQVPAGVVHATQSVWVTLRNPRNVQGSHWSLEGV